MDANATDHGLEVSRAPHERGVIAQIVPDDATLFEIAIEVGFQNSSHFGRKFREIFGTTPIRLREERRRA